METTSYTMNKFTVLICFFLLTIFACEQDEIQTCESEGTSCVRVQNNAGAELQDVRIRLVTGGTIESIGDVANGAVSEYVSMSGADWCNYFLEAGDAAGGVYKSGDWIHSVAEPLGNGQFTVVLTLSPRLPAEATFLNAELITD